MEYTDILLRSSRNPPSNPLSNDPLKKCTQELRRYPTVMCTYETLFQGQH